MHGVYLVLDIDATDGRAPSSVAEAALRGGITALQWRQKSGTIGNNWDELLRVQELCRSHDTPFLVNDYVDVALAVNADGAHIGQDDLPSADARGLLAHRILGVSITELAHVQPAVDAGADYLGVGPVFATRSKLDAVPARGLSFLTEVRALTDLPVVAIGGITLENARAVMAAGANAIAVLSAICGAADVREATRSLTERITGAGRR